jgi:hypothetical protein
MKKIVKGFAVVHKLGIIGKIKVSAPTLVRAVQKMLKIVFMCIAANIQKKTF